MYSFLNDISISPAGITVLDSRQLIKELINTVFLLKKFKIERIRVPENFAHVAIAGSVSIAEFYQTSTDAEERGLILGFLENMTEVPPSENIEAVEQADAKHLFDIYLDGVSSHLLKEAYVKNSPTVSFASHPSYQADFLNCKKYIVTEKGDRNLDILLNNVNNQNIQLAHFDYLLQINVNIIFSKRKLDPSKNPCWREEVTKGILDKYNYPNCLDGLSQTECRSINMQLAPMILEANGWVVNSRLTSINRGRTEVWKVYTNRLGEEVHVSVDLVEGEFEIQDRNGKWVKTVFFDGKDTGKDYSQFKNSKNKDGHHIDIK